MGRVDVSVVISTRNRASWLLDCLRSLAAQRCRLDFEVIVVDNGSTDETPRVLADWCGADRRFRTVREERIGLSVGKNRGISLARAPLILFTDDDVRVGDAWIHSYVDLFERIDPEQAIAGGPIVPIPDDLGAWPSWFDRGAVEDLALLDHRVERPLVAGEYVWGANMAVPRTMFERFGGWDESIGVSGIRRNTFEDAELQDRVRRHDVRVWFCPHAVVHHRVPRSRIVPRVVVANAFNRARNEWWASQSQRFGPEVDDWPRRDVVVGATRLAMDVARWLAWTAAFRVRRTGEKFRRLRRAAYDAGRSLQRLSVGHRLIFRALARVTVRLPNATPSGSRSSEDDGE